MTPSELKFKVESRGTESHYFDRKTMRFFGDTMRNFGVRDAGMVKTYTGESVPAWELYRKRAVKSGNKASAYFHKETFQRVFPV